MDIKYCNISPSDFEVFVERIIQRMGVHLDEFSIRRLERVSGSDGEYEIDITVRFKALGVNFLTLVECKKYNSRIKRLAVQVLHAQVDSLGANKGIMFSTADYQRSAIRYANNHGISLIKVTENGLLNLTPAFGFPIDIPVLSRYSAKIVSSDSDDSVVNFRAILQK